MGGHFGICAIWIILINRDTKQMDWPVLALAVHWP